MSHIISDTFYDAHAPLYVGARVAQNPAVSWRSDMLRVMITVRKANMLEALADAHDARVDDRQTLHYAPRDFVLIGMPYRRPPNPGMFERRNGNFHFCIVSRPDIGVPFGQDRLLPFWLASAYFAQGCPESRTIVFRAAGDILRCYGIEPHGNQHQRLRERIERIFAATFMVEDKTPGAGLSSDVRRRARASGSIATGFIRAHRYQLIDSLSLWVNRETQANQFTLWQNTITLSEQFAQDVKDCAIPVDLETIRALRTRPLALDLYVWQSWRSWRMKEMNRASLSIPLRGDGGVLAQLGLQVQRTRKAIGEVRDAQRIIRATWTECKNTIEKDTLVIRPCSAIRRKRALIMPGVNNPPKYAGERMLATRNEGGELLALQRRDEP